MMRFFGKWKTLLKYSTFFRRQILLRFRMQAVKIWKSRLLVLLVYIFSGGMIKNELIEERRVVLNLKASLYFLRKINVTAMANLIN
jgi:hypothetical protein